MRVDEAFDIFQGKIDADASHVRKARHRRDLFSDAFKDLEDVRQVIPSGSLARGTQLDPIHDVDLIVVFDAAVHPDWGGTGVSAGSALSYVQEWVRLLLGDHGSVFRRAVGETLVRNHVVKCFLDPRFLAQDPDFKSFFAVEVMPALRANGALLVPERKKDQWQTVDPEWLIAEVRNRQERWRYFVRMIRVIKFWMRHVDSGVKPLAAEVLALNCLPDLISGLPRSVALQRFFTAASTTVMLAVRDPAGHCGEIQPDLKRIHVSDLLKEAAGIAATAVTWEQQDEDHQAICCWRAVFGDNFPLPPGGCLGEGGGDDGTSDPGSSDNGHTGGDRPRGNDDDPQSGNDPRSGYGGNPRHGDGGDVPDGGDVADGGRTGGGSDPRRGPVIPPIVPPTTPSGPRRPVKDAPQG
jgi:Nucleotidyltransferase domain